MNNEELINPELADVIVVEDSRDFSRSEVILKGALVAGAVAGTAMVGPFVAQGAGDVGQLRPGNPQLRPHPGVP